jgi:hypothetical protein
MSGQGEEWLEVTVRDWEGRKLYRERAYKLNQKKIKEIAYTLRDKFSINLVGSIRIESIKAKQEEEMEMVRQKVRARKAQIGNAVKKMLFPEKKEESKQNLNT